MPLDLATFAWIASQYPGKTPCASWNATSFRCRYCGLDGMASFENALVMGVDFVVPRARKGRKTPENLVASCRPCNVLKGRRRYSNFDEAKSFVLMRREQLRKEWGSRRAAQQVRYRLFRSARAASALLISEKNYRRIQGYRALLWLGREPRMLVR
jgi:hypothetical protein